MSELTKFLPNPIPDAVPRCCVTCEVGTDAALLFSTSAGWLCQDCIEEILEAQDTALPTVWRVTAVQLGPESTGLKEVLHLEAENAAEARELAERQLFPENTLSRWWHVAAVELEE